MWPHNDQAKGRRRTAEASQGKGIDKAVTKQGAIKGREAKLSQERDAIGDEDYRITKVSRASPS